MFSTDRGLPNGLVLKYCLLLVNMEFSVVCVCIRLGICSLDVNTRPANF